MSWPIAELLRRFPKERPPLPDAYAEIYARQYKENRTGGTHAATAAQRMEQWLHRRVAEDVRGGRRCDTLELGAGTLNQLPFEPQQGRYDIVEPFVDLYADSPHRGRVSDIFSDIRQAPLERRYDRITSVAVLEHVADLPFVLGRAAHLLAPSGSFRAAIPSEGGLLWRLGWSLTTGLEFKMRHRLNYGVIMRHEHLNTAEEIESLISALFRVVRIKTFGVGRQLSLYRFIEAADPDLNVAALWDEAAAAQGAPA